MREILTKTCFSPQVSHIQLKFAFLLFWCIYGEIQRELLFLFKIMTISERSSELLRKFVFLNKFEKGKIQRKIWICLNNCFWSNHLKGTNINKNFFSPVCEPYTAKLCFSFFLKHFWGNSQRTSFFIKKKKFFFKVSNIQIKWFSVVLKHSQNFFLFQIWLS